MKIKYSISFDWKENFVFQKQFKKEFFLATQLLKILLIKKKEI